LVGSPLSCHACWTTASACVLGRHIVGRPTVCELVVRAHHAGRTPCRSSPRHRADQEHLTQPVPAGRVSIEDVHTALIAEAARGSRLGHAKPAIWAGGRKPCSATPAPPPGRTSWTAMGKASAPASSTLQAVSASAMGIRLHQRLRRPTTVESRTGAVPGTASRGRPCPCLRRIGHQAERSTPARVDRRRPSRRLTGPDVFRQRLAV
jgi:hypothetical protein